MQTPLNTESLPLDRQPRKVLQDSLHQASALCTQIRCCWAHRVFHRRGNIQCPSSRRLRRWPLLPGPDWREDRLRRHRNRRDLVRKPVLDLSRTPTQELPARTRGILRGIGRRDPHRASLPVGIALPARLHLAIRRQHLLKPRWARSRHVLPFPALPVLGLWTPPGRRPHGTRAQGRGSADDDL